jgi:hypothetical protein
MLDTYKVLHIGVSLNYRGAAEMAKAKVSTRTELMRHSDLADFEPERNKTSKKPRNET